MAAWLKKVYIYIRKRKRKKMKESKLYKVVEDLYEQNLTSPTRMAKTHFLKSSLTPEMKIPRNCTENASGKTKVWVRKKHYKKMKEQRDNIF